MTREIQRSEWGAFFDNLSQDLFNWDTTVRVLNDDAGAQILSDGLPFNGLTLTDTPDGPVIELSLGAGQASHQTHNIAEPKFVAFADSSTAPAGTLEILDVAGTNTLITVNRPLEALAGSNGG